MSSQELVPAGSHTLVINEPDTTRAILLMDSHDLEQAMAELRGEVLATFVYRPKGAKPQLTYAGVKEAARLYRNVHFGATAVPLGDGTWMITSYAHNLADNTRVDYPMPYPAFNPANPDEAIKFRANLSKSLRNALAAVLPVAYLQTMIERWLEQGNEGRAMHPQSGRAVPPPAPQRNVTPARSTGSAPVTAPVPQPQAHAPAPGEDVVTERPHAARRTPNAAEEEWPRSATDWSGDQLRSRIEEKAGGALKTGPAWKALAREHGVPEPTSATELGSRTWLLGLYQALRCAEYQEMIASVDPRAPDAEERVSGMVAEALSERDRRCIGMGHYDAVYAKGEARKAELSAPLLAGGQGRAQVAS